jgi:hypothetical protein
MKRTWINNIEMNIRIFGWKYVELFHTVQKRIMFQVFVITVINLGFPWRQEISWPEEQVTILVWIFYHVVIFIVGECILFVYVSNK